jgi:hypothetical protein
MNQGVVDGGQEKLKTKKVTRNTKGQRYWSLNNQPPSHKKGQTFNQSQKSKAYGENF